VKEEIAIIKSAFALFQKHPRLQQMLHAGLHFGAGQTEAMVTLPKGEHTLQLVLGDWTHIPHVPPVMSDVITVTVR
jgi:Domain of unknown function (DUF4399)